ncbi:MAG: hypothetical protein IPI39_16750 [Candidatus Obscuribacter sp.]|nr:hypothetical protein [Candidatus Obscuribacter sp.]
MKVKSVASDDAAYVTVANRVEQLWRSTKKCKSSLVCIDEETRLFTEQAKTA